MPSFNVDLEVNMIKECKVTIQNSFSSIVMFDDVEVQVPTNSVVNGVAYVKYENEIYSVANKEDYEKFLKPKADKKSKKVKTTETDLVEEVVESEAVVNETDEISE